MVGQAVPCIIVSPGTGDIVMPLVTREEFLFLCLLHLLIFSCFDELDLEVMFIIKVALNHRRTD